MALLKGKESYIENATEVPKRFAHMKIDWGQLLSGVVVQ